MTFRLEVVNLTQEKQKDLMGRITFNDDRSVSAFSLDPVSTPSIS